MIEEIAKYCKEFRAYIIRVNLTDFCNELNVNAKNLYAFENGKANNIKYLYYYYHMCKSDEMRTEFITGLFAIGNDSEVLKWL